MVLTDSWKNVVDYYSRNITPLEVLFMQHFCRLRTSALLLALFKTANRLGDWPLWVGCAVYLLTFGGVTERYATVVAIGAVGFSVAFFMAVKNLIGRPRPCEAWHELTCLMAAPDKFSFPSGHTMTAFAAFGVFSALLPAGSAFFLSAAVLIGLSRVFLGLHYPTDVLVGAVLGTAIGRAVVWGMAALTI